THPGLPKASGLLWMRRNSSGQSDIGPVGCSGNFYSSRSNRTLCSPAGGFPFSKKISLLHSHVLFLLCVELNLVLVMGYCLVFIFVLPITKHLPCQFLKFLSNQWLAIISGVGGRGVRREVLPFAP